MHKRGYSRHAVSVRLSRSWIMSKRTNISPNFFPPSGSHTILVFPYQTEWRYSDGNPPNGGVECMRGIGRNRDSGLIDGYRRLLDVRSAKTFTDDEAEYMTQSATHHWLSIDCWTRANYEVTIKIVTDDHAVYIARSATHHRMFVCDGLHAAWTNTPKRREQKRI